MVYTAWEMPAQQAWKIRGENKNLLQPNDKYVRVRFFSQDITLDNLWLVEI